MRQHFFVVAPAVAGAAAYTIAKVDLALRAELGMPGFPAPPDAYSGYDPVLGQLSNAVMGLVMMVLIGALARPPHRRRSRRILLALNAVALGTAAVMVVVFTLRAAGAAPGLGAPAVGPVTWLTLAVGAGWVVAWLSALVRASRTRPQ